MKKAFVLLCLATLLVTCTKEETVSSPARYVDNIQSTCLGMPLGMHLWKVRTDAHSKFCGFCQSHIVHDGVDDYGRFSLMPTTTLVAFSEDMPTSAYTVDSAEVSPCHISADLLDSGIKAELAATERAALMRFTYPDTDSAFVVLDALEAGSFVSVLPEENKIVGFSAAGNGSVPGDFRNYFVIKFDTPITCVATVSDCDTLSADYSCTGRHVCAVISFPAGGKTVHARVASSFISLEQADRNMAEVSGDFEAVRNQGIADWNRALARVSLGGKDAGNIRTFYTRLHRALLAPRTVHEYLADGSAVHFSPYNGAVGQGYMYLNVDSDEALRSLMPMLNLLYPSEAAKIHQGLANAYSESASACRYVEPALLADAYSHGLLAQDMDMLWDVIRYTSHSKQSPRPDKHSYDDWCIYTLGKSLGKQEYELRAFRECALNHTVADTCITPESLLNAPHDLRGTIAALGGVEAFNQKLDSLIALKDSSVKLACLYNYTDRPWMCQEVSHRLADNTASDADYVFSALGFYPLCPGSGQYVLTSPRVETAVIHLENGNKITIKAMDNSEANPYIASMTVNGIKHSGTYISYDSLLDGADMVYKMSSSPAGDRVTAAADYPYSFSDNVEG